MRLFTSSDTFFSAIFILNHTFLAYFYHLYIQTYTYAFHMPRKHTTPEGSKCVGKVFPFHFFLFCFALYYFRKKIIYNVVWN